MTFGEFGNAGKMLLWVLVRVLLRVLFGVLNVVLWLLSGCWSGWCRNIPCYLLSMLVYVCLKTIVLF